MNKGVYKLTRTRYNWTAGAKMGDLAISSGSGVGATGGAIEPVAEKRVTSQDRLLALIQSKHPDYHPVLAMVEIAQDQRRLGEEGNPVLEFQCHKEVAKYVVQVDRFVEVKQETRKTQRVIVELFGAPDQPTPPAVLSEVTDVETRIVASGPAEDSEQEHEERPTDLASVWNWKAPGS